MQPRLSTPGMFLCAVPGVGDAPCDKQALTASWLLLQLSEPRSPSAFPHHASSLLPPGPGIEPISWAVKSARARPRREEIPRLGRARAPPGSQQVAAGGSKGCAEWSGAGSGRTPDRHRLRHRPTAPRHTPLKFNKTVSN